MKSQLLILLSVMLIGCGQIADKSIPAKRVNKPIPKTQKFFADWLKAHGHTDVEADSAGVGIAGNPTRLSASLYGSDPKPNGCVVEIEFRIQLAPGREIVEFLAGVGTDEETAINDTLANFVLTTFHPIYKAFINEDDPHIESEKIELGGVPRELIMGDLYLRGPQESGQIDMAGMKPQIQDALKSVNLSSDPHWIKLVYMQVDNKPQMVSVTLDNEQHPALTNLITHLSWPPSKQSYIAKQFIIIK